MDVETLFQQFARTRDPAALGEVFDRCADALFAVALHLAPDRSTAEDLVQATFLIAIERAGRWQTDRPLQPWLLGILHREAKVLRRRTRRQVDPRRLPEREQPPPVQTMAAHEASAAVTSALVAVPMPYREVLELHLVQALPAAAIAERLQRSPGAVRTQLWRGLERLRSLLPAGLAMGITAQLLANVPLAAVRARVLEAATTAKVVGVGATGGVLLGGILMKKMLVVVVLALVALGAWLTRPSLTPASAAGDPAAGPVADAATPAAPRPSAAPRPEPAATRTAVAASPLEAGPASAEPATAPVSSPVMLPVLVVDPTGAPVADAIVQQLAPLPQSPSMPAVEVRTDHGGRTRLLVDGPCTIRAEKPGLGWSEHARLDRPARPLPAELRLVLLPTATVRGVVRLPDGQPAVGATILASRPSGTQLSVDPSDAQGRFSLVTIATDDPYQHELTLFARLGDRYTDRVFPRPQPGATVEVELQFPGAFGVRGTLRDHAGRPLRGRVHLHTTPLEPLHGENDWQVECDADGRFEILLTRPGEFDLAGGGPGQAATHQRLVLHRSRPHADVELRTGEFAPIEGMLVDEQRQPLAGVKFGLVLDGEQDAAMGMRQNLQQSSDRGTTDGNGAFRCLVPAGWRYRMAVWPEAAAGHHVVIGPVLIAPATDHRLMLRDSDRQGFVVEGRVVAAADGAPVPEFVTELVTYHDGNGSSIGAEEQHRDGTFRRGPLLAGRRVALLVSAAGFARTRVGPFDTTVRTEQIVVRLPRLGTVRCRVLRADGTPAARAWANLRPAVDDPFAPAWQGETEADGSITFAAVPPGLATVRATGAREQPAGNSAEVTVQPGMVTELRITLPD